MFQPDDCLQGSPPDSGSQKDADDDVDIDYGFEYDLITAGLHSSNTREPSSEMNQGGNHGSDGEAEEREAEFQFRLFAARSTSSAPTSQRQIPITKQTVQLSPTPPPTTLADSLSLDKAHFIRPSRPEDYYFTSALPSKTLQTLKSQFADVALSTSDVLSLATKKWQGTALPWRLIHVKLAKPRKHQRQCELLQSASLSVSNKEAPPTSSLVGRAESKKPSKKRRILLRRRLALWTERTRSAQVTLETEKEKRTRRNREKKVKRKEREKRKKLELGGDVPGDDGSDGAECRDENVDGTDGAHGNHQATSDIPQREIGDRKKVELQIQHSPPVAQFRSLNALEPLISRTGSSHAGAPPGKREETACHIDTGPNIPAKSSSSSAFPARRAPTAKAPTAVIQRESLESKTLKRTRQISGGLKVCSMW